MQRIFQMYTKEGLSINAIAQLLTRTGVPTHCERRGIGPRRKLSTGGWHPSALHDMLTNETYIGTLYYGKRERKASPNNPDRKTAWRRKPKEEWISIAVPAIIDQETFHATQARFKHNAQNSRRNRKYEYLLCNRRLRCGHCGYVMTGRYNPMKDWRYYRCNGYRYQADHSLCRNVGADRLEKTVWDAIERVLRNQRSSQWK